jgi:hypothetical protein
MGDTWITNINHFLSPDGDIADMPGPAINLAKHITSIIAAITSHYPAIHYNTGIWCRRRPGRKPCQGEIYATLSRLDNEIKWYCPICGDNGIISGWQGTLWDRSNKMH